jgi:hypothetical protein
MPNLNKIKEAGEVISRYSWKRTLLPETINLDNSDSIKEISKCLDEAYNYVLSTWSAELVNAIYTISQECQLDSPMPEEIIKELVEVYLELYYTQETERLNPDVLKIIKLFIKNEDISRFDLVKGHWTRKTEIEKLLTDIYLADWISGVIPEDLELKKVLHEYLYSNPENKLKDIGQEAEQKDFIERIKRNYDYGNTNNFYRSMREKISLLSEGLLSKIINEIPTIKHLLIPSSFSQEELQLKEADILHKLLGISPTPLAAILNSGLNIWKNDELKEKTLNFYLEVYKDFPEVIQVIEKMRQEEKFEITEEEKTNCIKCLNENIGHSFTKISEEDIVSYMLYDNSILESIYSMIHNISLKKPVQESLRAIYQEYKKLDPMLLHIVQRAFQYQIDTNKQLKMQVESLEQKCEKQQEETRKLQDQVSELFRLMKNRTVADTSLATSLNESPEFNGQSFFSVP